MPFEVDSLAFDVLPLEEVVRTSRESKEPLGGCLDDATIDVELLLIAFSCLRTPLRLSDSLCTVIIARHRVMRAQTCMVAHA